MIRTGLIAACWLVTCVAWAQDDLLDGGLLEGGLLEESEAASDGDLLGDSGGLLDGGDGLLDDSGGLLDGDLLSGEPPAAATTEAVEAADVSPADDDRLTADEIHRALFEEAEYPSANTCGSCHPRQYEQWAVSQHAYAQISPVYMAMQRTINAQTSSTNGDFCIR